MSNVLLGESTLYGGADNVITSYCFKGCPCLNSNHVIIEKDFHDVFAYYGMPKHTKIMC